MRLLLIVALAALPAAFAAAEVGPTTRPVVVELFTSEGCSSCPPADALLTELARTQPVEGVHIIPLAFHIDYWNYLGWADPFSSPLYTARQRAYATALRVQTFTPQAIVNGQVSTTASRRESLVRAIEQAPPMVAPAPTLTITRDGDGLTLTATLPRTNVPGAVATCVITEDGLTSDVRAGENSGRRLPHTATVRAVHALPGPSADRDTPVSVRLPLSSAWNPARLRATLLVHRPTTHAVLAAATAPVPPPAKR